MVNEAMMLNAATTKMKLRMANVTHFSVWFVWVTSLCFSSRVKTFARWASSPIREVNSC